MLYVTIENVNDGDGTPGVLLAIRRERGGEVIHSVHFTGVVEVDDADIAERLGIAWTATGMSEAKLLPVDGGSDAF